MSQFALNSKRFHTQFVLVVAIPLIVTVATAFVYVIGHKVFEIDGLRPLIAIHQVRAHARCLKALRFAQNEQLRTGIVHQLDSVHACQRRDIFAVGRVDECTSKVARQLKESCRCAQRRQRILAAKFVAVASVAVVGDDLRIGVECCHWLWVSFIAHAW